jgi:hypothetical protein
MGTNNKTTRLLKSSGNTKYVESLKLITQSITSEKVVYVAISAPVFIRCHRRIRESDFKTKQGEHTWTIRHWSHKYSKPRRQDKPVAGSI